VFVFLTTLFGPGIKVLFMKMDSPEGATTEQSFLQIRFLEIGSPEGATTELDTELFFVFVSTTS